MSKHTPFAFAGYMPVELRHRHNGWTPVLQLEFLVAQSETALSENACAEDACRAVGMSPASADALRRRIEAAAFRAAWIGVITANIGNIRAQGCRGQPVGCRTPTFAPAAPAPRRAPAKTATGPPS